MTQLGQLYEKETVQLSANVRKRLVILRMDNRVGGYPLIE